MFQGFWRDLVYKIASQSRLTQLWISKGISMSTRFVKWYWKANLPEFDRLVDGDWSGQVRLVLENSESFFRSLVESIDFNCFTWSVVCSIEARIDAILFYAIHSEKDVIGSLLLLTHLLRILLEDVSNLFGNFRRSLSTQIWAKAGRFSGCFLQY